MNKSHIPLHIALAVEIARDTTTNHTGWKERYLTVVPFGYNGNKKHGLEKRCYLSQMKPTQISC